MQRWFLSAIQVARHAEQIAIAYQVDPGQTSQIVGIGIDDPVL